MSEDDSKKSRFDGMKEFFSTTKNWIIIGAIILLGVIGVAVKNSNSAAVTALDKASSIKGTADSALLVSSDAQKIATEMRDSSVYYSEFERLVEAYLAANPGVIDARIQASIVEIKRSVKAQVACNNVKPKHPKKHPKNNDEMADNQQPKSTPPNNQNQDPVTTTTVTATDDDGGEEVEEPEEEEEPEPDEEE